MTFIISGDFNIHIYVETDQDASDFINLFEAFDFSQHVRGSPHNNGHTFDLLWM